MFVFHPLFGSVGLETPLRDLPEHFGAAVLELADVVLAKLATWRSPFPAVQLFAFLKADERRNLVGHLSQGCLVLAEVQGLTWVYLTAHCTCEIVV